MCTYHAYMYIHMHIYPHISIHSLLYVYVHVCYVHMCMWLCMYCDQQRSETRKVHALRMYSLGSQQA